jgi:hypothetical protein
MNCYRYIGTSKSDNPIKRGVLDAQSSQRHELTSYSAYPILPMEGYGRPSVRMSITSWVHRGSKVAHFGMVVALIGADQVN